MISILLADDHQVVRDGLRALLESQTDITLVGEAGDGIEAVRLCEELHPDVLLADLMMPGLNGLDVVRQVKRTCPRTSVVVLSMHSNESYVLEALKNGARGYVLKSSPGSDLTDAIRAVAGGGRYLSPPLTERAIEAYVGSVEDRDTDPYASLTDREREMLHLSAEGLSSSQIASQLSLSYRTVESHRSNLMAKLGLRSRIDLIRYALRRGIIPLED